MDGDFAATPAAQGMTPASPRLSYRVEGGKGPPVLLVMGFGMVGEVWRPQVDGLRADHRVAFYDARGLGRSEPTARPFGMRDMASDALRVADAAGFRTFHLVGVSMGGMVAQEVALAAEARLRSLTLIATHPGGGLSFVPPRRGLECFLRASYGPRRERVQALTGLLYPPAWVATTDQRRLARRMRDSVGVPAPHRTRLYQMAAVVRHHTADRLPRLRVPTLIVRAGEDVLIEPAQSDRLARLIEHAEVARFDDAGHGLVFQCADALNARLAAHFAANEPPQT